MSYTLVSHRASSLCLCMASRSCVQHRPIHIVPTFYLLYPSFLLRGLSVSPAPVVHPPPPLCIFVCFSQCVLVSDPHVLAPPHNTSSLEDFPVPPVA